jgi:hypothetical protein
MANMASLVGAFVAGVFGAEKYILYLLTAILLTAVCWVGTMGSTGNFQRIRGMMRFLAFVFFARESIDEFSSTVEYPMWISSTRGCPLLLSLHLP